MIGAATASFLLTKKQIHRKNEFTFRPLREVAILFAAIFATMVPALDWMQSNASHLGVTSAGQFYWGSGLLSSVLDNAPTYLNFLSASVGLFVDENKMRQVLQLIATHGSAVGIIGAGHGEEIKNTLVMLLRYHSDLVASGSVPMDNIKTCYLLANHAVYVSAISLGAVFFGAMTYIGNGPNFMVKSIAEHSGAPVPGFTGYIGKYSIPLLIPIFAVVWWLFFRG
jgi:Na+/H+ antiporter NhaD/arsenite permease-like protein